MSKSKSLSQKKFFLVNGIVLIFLALAVLMAVLVFYMQSHTTGEIRGKAAEAVVNYPSDLTNIDLSKWKLTLPIGAPTEITNLIGQIDPKYGSAPYFHLNAAKNAIVFMAPAGGSTTGNTDYARSELREMGGVAPYSITSDCTVKKEGAACWSSTIGYHKMTITQKITHIPVTKPEVVVGQIHDAKDDVVVFRLDGRIPGKSGRETNRLYVNVDGTADDYTLDDNYVLGTPFTVTFEVYGGKTYYYYNGQPVMNKGTGSVATLNRAYKNAYFKDGMYTQSVEGSGAYGEVEVSALSLCHGEKASDCPTTSLPGPVTPNPVTPTPTPRVTPTPKVTPFPVTPTPTPRVTPNPSTPTPAPTTSGKITNLTAVSTGDSKVKLAWSAYPGAKSYKIYVDKYAKGQFEAKSITTSTSVSYNDLKSKQASYFKVEAYDQKSGKGNKIATSDISGALIK